MALRIKHACPVCCSTREKLKFKALVKEDDPGKLYGAASGMRGTQRIVSCLDCEMIYESPRYEAQTIIQGYMDSEEEGHDSQYLMRVHSFSRALVKLKKYLPRHGSKVLDIGTAGGAFLDAAKQFGYDAYGMEPSEYLVSRGKARGLQIEQGTIETHTFPYHSFDMVCLWDVIEHLPHPKLALIEIGKLLKKDGILLINYPDIGTWQAKLAGKHFWWIISVHLHHFTRLSIKNICSRTGFKVFNFRRYLQTLEFGYLMKMAVHYRVPFAMIMTRVLPQFIQKIPIPYYASQTTVLARILK